MAAWLGSLTNPSHGLLVSPFVDGATSPGIKDLTLFGVWIDDLHEILLRVVEHHTAVAELPLDYRFLLH